MKKALFLVAIVAVLIGLSFIEEPGKLENYHLEDSDGLRTSVSPAPDGYTGAPGEFNCTNCHFASGAPFSTAGNVDYLFSGANNEYIPGQTYTIDLALLGNNPKNGFSMTILDNNDEKAGTFTAGTGSTVTSTNNREYVKHDDAYNTSWQFQWTAPATDLGDLTAYYCFNKTDDNFGVGGDTVYMAQEPILSSGLSEIKEYQDLQNNFNAFLDPHTNELVLNFVTSSASKVDLYLFDSSGRLKVAKDFGKLSADNYSERLSLADVHGSGVHIVQLVVGQYGLHQKVMIP